MPVADELANFPTAYAADFNAARVAPFTVRELAALVELIAEVIRLASRPP